jgi:hypothetical protein
LTDYFSSNLALLEKRQPAVVAILRQSLRPEAVAVFPSRRSAPTASCKNQQGQDIYLHSRSDPMLEARQQVAKIDCVGVNYFILLGFGLGYGLEALLERPGSADLHYFVVEADPAILAAAFSARDLSPLLKLPHLYFAHPAAGPALAAQWNSFFDPVDAQKSSYVLHPPSLSIQPSVYKSAVDLIQSQIFQVFTDINTLVARSQVFLDNFIENLQAARRAPGILIFKNAFAGKPAVLVSAGPSLDKNIGDLTGAKGNAVIIAADTSVKPLLSIGVEPHFIVTGDPSLANYLHIQGAKLENAVIIAEATAHPGVFREFPGRIGSCIYENSSLRSLSMLLGDKGSLRAWGSVATMAMDLALHLGCSPVIFMGQDLAHSGGRLYCSGVYFEENWYAGIASPEEYDRRSRELRAGRKEILMEDIFGKPIETTDKLASYWNWIAKEIASHPHVHFINATEGGILRDKVSILSLREALWKYGVPGLNPRAAIREIWQKALQTPIIPICEPLGILKSESMFVEESLEQGFQICRDCSLGQNRDLLGRLEQAKEQIYEAVHLAGLIDSFNQMGNLNFLRAKSKLGKSLDNHGSTEDAAECYREYFESVRSALGVISQAIAKIPS